MKILTKLFVAFFLLVFASRIYAKEQIVIETDNTGLVSPSVTMGVFIRAI